MYNTRYIQQDTVDESVPVFPPLFQSRFLFRFRHGAVFYRIDGQLFEESQVFTLTSHPHESEVPVVTQALGSPEARIVGSDYYRKITGYQDGSGMVPVIVHQLEDLIGDGGYLQGYPTFFHHVVQGGMFEDGVPVAYSRGIQQNGVEEVDVRRFAAPVGLSSVEEELRAVFFEFQQLADEVYQWISWNEFNVSIRSRKILAKIIKNCKRRINVNR